MGVITREQYEAIDTERLENTRAGAESAMLADPKFAEALAAGGMTQNEIDVFARNVSNVVAEPNNYANPDYQAHAIDIVIDGKNHTVDLTDGVNKEEAAALQAFAEAKKSGGQILYNGANGDHRTVEITTPSVPKMASVDDTMQMMP